ncbi:MAG: NADH-quinone oxidoreductase subunit NuoE [Bdellovibrionales bacterium]
MMAQQEKLHSAPFKLSKEGQDLVKKELDRYEDKMSAIIPCLYQAQKENGWISPEVIDTLSKEMDIPPARIQEVAMFYTMFNKKPVGKYHIQVCCNISCCMAGGREITQKLLNKFQVGLDEMTKDGKFTVTKVECLGSCGTAPMMQVNDEYYENLTQEKIDKLIAEFK